MQQSNETIVLGKAAFVAQHVHIRRDIIGAKGHPGKTKRASLACSTLPRYCYRHTIILKFADDKG